MHAIKTRLLKQGSLLCDLSDHLQYFRSLRPSSRSKAENPISIRHAIMKNYGGYAKLILLLPFIPR